MQTYAPQDTLVGPIVHALAQIVTNQIQGVGTVYERDPDGPPPDNSVTIPLTQYKILSDTNGRIEIRLVFSLMHWFRRGKLGTGIQSCYNYLIAYLQAFAAWDNQALIDGSGNQISRIISVHDGGVTSRSYYKSLEPYVALVVNVEVVTEFLINVTP